MVSRGHACVEFCWCIMNEKNKLRAAAISFINARPLVHALTTKLIDHRFDLQLAVPSACSSMLEASEVQLALIPSIEYSNLRKQKHLGIVPEIAISSRHVVKSVELFFNKGLSNLRKVAVDASSRTSVALLKVVLREKYGLQPEFIRMQPDVEAMLAAADGALIIGDMALDLYLKRDNRIDLVDEWSDLTGGLPFVFAFWVSDPDVLTPSDIEILKEAKLYGKENIATVTSAALKSDVTSFDFSEEVLFNYLSENLCYEFRQEETEGLMEFYRYCFFYGIIEEIPSLNFIT